MPTYLNAKTYFKSSDKLSEYIEVFSNIFSVFITSIEGNLLMTISPLYVPYIYYNILVSNIYSY